MSGDGKIRNRAEAHLIGFAQQLLAKPVALDIHDVRGELLAEQGRTTTAHPSWGSCRVSDISICSRIIGKPHLVTRKLAIYGRGRAIYSLLITETVTKNTTAGCLPVL